MLAVARDSGAIEPAHWHVMLTTPQGEATAAGGLVGRGFSVLAPQFRKRVRHGRGKIIERQYSLFPGYIFVECSASDYIRVRQISGIRDFLRSEGAPVLIRGEAVFAIRDKEIELEAKFNAKRKMKYTHDFKPGDKVEIVEGPFAPMLATIEALDNRGRIIILHYMLGRTAKITLDAPQIRAA